VDHALSVTTYSTVSRLVLRSVRAVDEVPASVINPLAAHWLLWLSLEGYGGCVEAMGITG